MIFVHISCGSKCFSFLVFITWLVIYFCCCKITMRKTPRPTVLCEKLASHRIPELNFSYIKKAELTFIGCLFVCLFFGAAFEYSILYTSPFLQINIPSSLCTIFVHFYIFLFLVFGLVKMDLDPTAKKTCHVFVHVCMCRIFNQSSGNLYHLPFVPSGSVCVYICSYREKYIWLRFHFHKWSLSFLGFALCMYVSMYRDGL